MRDLTVLELAEIRRFDMEFPPEMWNDKKPHKIDRRYEGVFRLFRGGAEIHVIASTGGGWDHVSVSCRDRCPTWDEMSYVAKMFFEPNEYAVQYHVPASEHVNRHPFTLHWWRPTSKLPGKRLPHPPKDYV
jgi:hypothetical protein